MIFKWISTRALRRQQTLSLLLPLLLSACAVVEQTPGIELDLVLVHEASEGQTPEDNPAGREFRTDTGVQVSLNYGYVTVSQVALVACEVARQGGVARPNRPSPFTLAQEWARVTGVAYAHGTTTPTILASPFVNGLERPDAQAVSLGVMKPPPGTYCGLNVSFEPADADAAALPADPNMVGQTLRLDGYWQTPDQLSTEELHVSSAQMGSVTIPFPQGSLALLDANAHHTLRLTLHYDQWLDSVAETAGDPDLLAMTVLQALQSSTTLMLD